MRICWVNKTVESLDLFDMTLKLDRSEFDDNDDNVDDDDNDDYGDRANNNNIGGNDGNDGNGGGGSCNCNIDLSIKN